MLTVYDSLLGEFRHHPVWDSVFQQYCVYCMFTETATRSHQHFEQYRIAALHIDLLGAILDADLMRLQPKGLNCNSGLVTCSSNSNIGWFLLQLHKQLSVHLCPRRFQKSTVAVTQAKFVQREGCLVLPCSHSC